MIQKTIKYISSKVNILDRGLFIVLLILCLYIFFQSYITRAFGFNLFLDELYTLSRKEKNIWSFWLNYLHARETHPPIFDYVISFIFSQIKGGLALIRSTSVLANALFCCTFFYYLFKKSKILSLSILSVFLAITNGVIAFWGVLVRSYSWQNFLFCLVCLLRYLIQHGKRLHYCYFITLLALGYLHYSSLMLVMLLILFEKKDILSVRSKIVSFCLLSPNIFSLIYILKEEKLQPQSINHYKVMSIDFIQQIIGNVFLPFVPFAGVLVSFILIIFLFKKRSEIINKILDELPAYSALGVFLMTSILSILLNKKWIIEHNFIFIYPALLILICSALRNHYKSVVILIFCSLLFHFENIETRATHYPVYKTPFSDSIEYLTMEYNKFINYKIISCDFGYAKDFASFFINYFSSPVKEEQFILICEPEEITRYVLGKDGTDSKVALITEGYSSDEIERFKIIFKYYDHGMMYN